MGFLALYRQCWNRNRFLTMKKVNIIIVIFSFFIVNSFSQQADTLKNNNGKSKIEQSMAYLPVMGFDYTLAFQPSKHLGFGFSVRYALAGELIISHPSLIKYYGQYPAIFDDYSIFNSSQVKFYVPLLGLSAFYRNYFAKNAYFDTGVLASLGYSSIVDKDFETFTRIIGGYLSINYGFEKVKFGHEFQIAAFDVQDFYQYDSRKPMFLFIPLIIRFRL